MAGVDIGLGIVQGLQQARDTMLEAATRKEEVAQRKAKADNQFKIDKLEIQKLENELSPDKLKRENDMLKAEYNLTMGYLDKAKDKLDETGQQAEYEYNVGTQKLEKIEEEKFDLEEELYERYQAGDRSDEVLKGLNMYVTPNKFKDKSENSVQSLLKEFSKQKAGTASAERTEGGFLGMFQDSSQKEEIEDYLSSDPDASDFDVSAYLNAIGSSSSEFQEWSAQNYPDVYKNAFPSEARMRSKRGASTTSKSYTSEQEVESAMSSGEIKSGDIIDYNGKQQKINF